MTWTVIGWGLCAFIGLLTIPATLAYAFRKLPTDSNRKGPGVSAVSVSVIVAARDESRRIETCLRSLLNSDHPSLEVVAVNDRSTDQTGAIMDRLAADDRRLRVIHIDQLPEGWLGKTNALHQGACRTDSRFLLFTDGDIVFAPDVIRLAVEWMERRGLDHLCLVPKILPGGWFEDSLVTYFGFVFCVGLQGWLVPTGFRYAYVGIGAFNLVRRHVWDECGGHGSIRMDLLDDVKLGKLIKQSGYRQDVLRAGDGVAVRWQSSAWNVIRGLEKNAFATFDYSVFRLGLAMLAAIALLTAPLVAVLTLSGPPSYGFAATVVLLHVLFGLVAATSGAGLQVVPAFYPAAFATVFAFVRSAVVTLRQQGVRWRDTFYPLDELRQGVFRGIPK